MEIERKWFVKGWPEDLGLSLTPDKIYQMEQGYIALDPTVRIRREACNNGNTEYILCFKGKGGIAREEIETAIDLALYDKLKAFIGLPMILKERRDYDLDSGLRLEVNLVDADQKTAFFYAEIEYPTEAAALAWKPSDPVFAAYLSNEVTGAVGVSMGAYWRQTRLGL